jgi:amidase
MEAAIATLKKQGAIVVDPLPYPQFLLDIRQPLLNTMMAAEFKSQITDYLKTTKPKYPKSFADLVTLSNDPKFGYRSPEKAFGFKYQASTALDLTDPIYIAAKNEGMPLYPTSPRPATLISPPVPAPTGGGSATGIANITGFPDLIVPAGMTKDGLPVTISFFGTAYTEAKLLGYGYDFEQATKARVMPKTTPALASDVISY